MEQVKKLVETITKGIQEKKGSNITIADLSGIEGSICRYFIICQGNSPSQVEAITDSVEETARVDAGEKPVHVVGLTHAHWGGYGLHGRYGTHIPSRRTGILQSGKPLGRRQADKTSRRGVTAFSELL